MLTPLLLALALQDAPDPERQFDFWIGEWSVQNRDIQADGSWLDGDRTRARIAPVCGGRALLEEWAGPFRGTFMNGFSLRAYDPAREDWDLLLFWTTDGNASFGKLRGTFRHGRGEFFAGRGDDWQRYTFSDALPHSVRWDSARTSDNGIHWATDWIMEFTRTRAASAVTQDELFDVAWTEGELSPHAEARRLDWMLGRWEGTQTDAATGAEREARLRCKLLDKDCLVLDLLETRAEETQPGDGADWDERLAVRGFVAGRGAWESYALTDRDPVLRAASAQPGEGVAVFESRGAGARRETLRRVADDRMEVEEAVRDSAEKEFRTVRVTRLRRLP